MQKRKLRERLSKTTKSVFKRIWIQGKDLEEANFLPGMKFSYDVDFTSKKVRIVPNTELSIKGTVSKKENKKSGVIPIIDANNNQIAKTFEGVNTCRITVFEDEIIVEAVEAKEEVNTSDSINSSVKTSVKSKVPNLVSLSAYKEQKTKSVALKKQLLDLILRKGKKTADGQMDLFSCGFSLSDDVVTQALSQTEQFKQDLPFINQTFKVLSLFTGLGAFEEALKNINVRHEVVNYCESEPFVSKSYSAVHGIDESKNLGKVETINPTTLPDFNLMTFGFPCQDLSALGKQKGALNEDGSLTRSGLVYEALKIARYKQPEYMIAENVRDLLSAKFKDFFNDILRIIKEIGYNVYFKKVNSKDYGVPHSRTRVFLVCIRADIDKGNFKFPTKEPLTIKASDWYEKGELDDSYYLEEKHMKYIEEFRLKKGYSTLNADVIACMNTKQGHRGSPQNFIKDSKGVRMLHEREMLRFQGFNPDYADVLKKVGMSLANIGHMMGNSITVQVMEKIFKRLIPMKYRLHLV